MVTGSTSTTGARAAEPGLLGIYLNDHVAGAVVGVGLARRAAVNHRGTPAGEVLERLQREIAEDRAELLAVLHTLGVPVRRYKQTAAWLGERAGRLKPNGHVHSRSPMSSVVELEVLRLGVEGKALGWTTLRAVAGREPRLDARRLDELVSRARRQAEELEELRVAAAAEAFGAG